MHAHVLSQRVILYLYHIRTLKCFLERGLSLSTQIDSWIDQGKEGKISFHFHSIRGS